MLSSINIENINNILNKISTTDEFEVMFNNYKTDNKLSVVKFMNMLKYLKYRSDAENKVLTNEVILDVSFDYEVNKRYRVSIYGIKNINDFLNLVHQRTNHVIFSILLSQTEFRNNKNFKYIKKQNDIKNYYDIDQYDIRIRKSSEEELSDHEINKILNLNLNALSKIYFRFKNRLSLEILNNDNERLAIDITILQSSSNPNEIYNVQKTYELELDYSLKKKINTDKVSKIIINEINTIKKVLEGTINILSKNEQQLIIEGYKKLVFLNESYDFNNTLYTMQPISAEVQHIVDKIPNKYSVTDKTDGNKYTLFVFNNIIYLISTNLNCIKTNYTSKNLNNSILEGELIYLYDQKKYLFLAFDCLYYNEIEIKNEPNLNKRLSYVTKFCKEINKENIYEAKEYNDTFSLDKQEKFYQDELKKFYKKINNLISKIEINDIVIHPKLFIFPQGGDNSEVFMYSHLIWNYCTSTTLEPELLCPYKLDGIIYTGIEQKYTKDKRDQKYPIYKYKPPNINSIDVYITFQKNIETGGYLDIYDNSVGDLKDNKVYRIVNFFVGDNIGTKEVPVPFMKEEQNNEAYISLINGEIRDVDGNFVQDSTVVEISYNNDPSIPHPYRWNILKTRWDKTESVITLQKQYGNFKDVAQKIWKSIIEAVTINEIKNLADPLSYPKQQKILETRLNSSIIKSERQQDIYYQKITNLAKKMRKYHNWLKSILIYTYCNPIKEKRTSVLDIGCGQGGDILKFYHSRVGEYVGIDIDYNGLYSSTNGALSRYNKFKKQFPNFGKVQWIQMDASIEFEANLQEAKIINMTKQNKLLIEKTFTKNKKFDVFSAQFSLHYLFDSEKSVENLIKNINNYLKIGGYIIITMFDALTIMKHLEEKNILTSYYTDENGIRNKFFEIVKKFDGPLKDTVGQAIDVYMAWFMEEDKYETEYLVTPKLLNNTMKKAGCQLIETDLFSNLYYLNQPYFLNVIEHEENPKNLKVYKEVAEYYGDLKGVDKESRMYTFLNRYYIYQKFN